MFTRRPRVIGHVLRSPYLAGLTSSVAVAASVRVTRWSVQFALPARPHTNHAMRQCLCKELPTQVDGMKDGRVEFEEEVWQSCCGAGGKGDLVVGRCDVRVRCGCYKLALQCGCLKCIVPTAHILW